MAWFALRFAGLLVWVGAALTSCERTRSSEPPTKVPVPVSITSRVPEGAARQEVAPEPDPKTEPAGEAEVACAPAGSMEPVEPVETWGASGPPPTRSTEEVCVALEQRARRAIEGLSGPCETAEDCELVRVACPFGCVRVFSRQADRRRARVAFDRYVDECPICKDKCPALPTALDCRDGECVASTEPPASTCSEALSDP